MSLHRGNPYNHDGSRSLIRTSGILQRAKWLDNSASLDPKLCKRGLIDSLKFLDVVQLFTRILLFSGFAKFSLRVASLKARYNSNLYMRDLSQVHFEGAIS